MLVCEDWKADPDRKERLSVFGLITTIVSDEGSSFPLNHPELCVLLILTECYRSGRVQIVCVSEEPGERVFATPDRAIQFPNDPLSVYGIPFRIRDCIFPKPGFYLMQFYFDGVLVEERPVNVR
jgi:hypothetical protein